MKRSILCALVVLAGCSGNGSAVLTLPSVSSTIAITSDDKMLWVVNQDSDSVSVIDANARSLVAEIPLGPTPTVDATTKRYEPALRPRALTILPNDRKVYVAAQAANEVLVLDAQSHAVTATIPVAADPTAVVAAPDGKTVYAVSHEAALVTRIDTASDTATGTLAVGEHPWSASLSADGKTLYVSQLLLSPGVTVIDTASFTVKNVVTLADQPPSLVSKLDPQGTPRGVYAAVPRPVGGDVWVPHLLLAIKTEEPDLDFESTVFPTISTLVPDGSAEGKRLLFSSLQTGTPGSFIDVVSGPHAIGFTSDGKLALVVNSQSEDVMVFDGETGFEVSLVRPLPSAFPEGIVLDHAGTQAFVEGRNTHDVTVLKIDRSDAITPVTVDGPAIERLQNGDPMPTNLRQGQRLFYSANSAAFPVTKNFWVACATCHVEGGSDAVTWLFTVGPRDTPSNAGGPINTGFLLRQGLRNSIFDYDDTINVEQGGTFHRADPTQQPLLQQLSDFVNYAIPYPQNPNRSSDGTLTPTQQHGQQIFQTKCVKCHTGAYLTDSGEGNPTLDLNGPIKLHDANAMSPTTEGLNSCVQNGPFNDNPAPDADGMHVHSACMFDTPSLRGVFATPPYLHDGSAPTLLDVINRFSFTSDLSDQDKSDLVDYLKTL